MLESSLVGLGIFIVGCIIFYVAVREMVRNDPDE